MSRIIFTLLLFPISFLGHLDVTQADEKAYDIIFKNNGEKMQGTIKEITDDVIKFSYPGETVFYTLKKTGIQKIIFANGRVEAIGAAGELSKERIGGGQQLVDYQHKVAVLPASVITDFQTAEGEISNRFQLACFNALSEKAKDLVFISPNTINALLLKQGIRGSEINHYTMEELCQLLGVHYLVQTVATINTNAGFYTHAEASRKDDVKTIAKVSRGATSYDTNIMLNIFDRDGKRLFGKDRTSIWHTADGYQKTIDYLAKRTPLYKK